MTSSSRLYEAGMSIGDNDIELAGLLDDEILTRLSWAEVIDRIPKCEHGKIDPHPIVETITADNDGCCFHDAEWCPGSPALQETTDDCVCSIDESCWICEGRADDEN